MGISNIWLFVIAAVVLIVTPGPSVFYIIARSINQGRTAGIASVLGVATGAAIHVIAAAVGISALLMTSSLAFNLVKYLGAAYLIYLGCRTLYLSKELDQPAIPKVESEKLAKIFNQSVIVEALNPKTSLFFLAFLPQFISPTGGSITLQFLILGGIFIAIGLISDGIYAFLASSVRKWILGSQLRTKLQNGFTGGTYIALGLLTAFASPQK